MKLRLAHAKDPIRAMKRPKPGTPAAISAMNSTNETRTAENSMPCVLELYLSPKDSCSNEHKPCQHFLVFDNQSWTHRGCQPLSLAIDMHEMMVWQSCIAHSKSDRLDPNARHKRSLRARAILQCLQAKLLNVTVHCMWDVYQPRCKTNEQMSEEVKEWLLECYSVHTFCSRLRSKISKTGTSITGNVNSRPRHKASLTAIVLQSCGRFSVMMSSVASP